MPRPKSVSPPRYLRHTSGQARVIIEGRTHYLGSYGSSASREKYERLIHEWLARRSEAAPPPPTAQEPGLLLCELMAAYLEYIDHGYGRKTPIWYSVRDALRIAKALYLTLPAAQFGPLALKACREKMVADQDWSRAYVNRQVQRLCQMFRWAAEQELLPITLYHSLKAVPGLRAGKTAARETSGVKPVPLEVIQQTLPHLPPVVQAMVQIQLLGGMRPGEICILRPIDLDTTGEVWTYRPARHKTQHRGKDRVIYLNRQAQELLTPFLDVAPDAFCFSPAVAEQERQARRRAQRQTPLSPAQERRRPEANRRRAPGPHYTRLSYATAIARACAKAEVRVWRPNRLRHTAATLVRARFGLEAAQLLLGHARCDVTQVYAEANDQKLIEIVKAFPLPVIPTQQNTA